MNDAATGDGLDRGLSESRAPTDAQMNELRRLLLAPEQNQLLRLQERLDEARPRAENVSELLPEAVALRTRKDRQLQTALMPTVEEAIGISVKRDPHRLVDAIFPVMGPAIRKAIAHAFSEMVQSLNQTLEHSLSIKGLRWRLEAFRTGKSFAEVVLSHTLLYRVEEVFLIHKQTGLLLQHAALDPEATEDSDLVSGMLTAIQDFVHDAFRAGKEGALESLQVGDLNVWIEQGAHAALAAVIRGSAPRDYRRVLEDARDAIHVLEAEALEEFRGDPAPFIAARPHLENCLKMQAETKSKKPSPALWATTGLLLALLGVWLFFYIRDSLRWSDYIERLKAQPGIVVVSSEREGGKFHVTGLRDPLAADPASLLAQTKLDPEDVVGRWEHYQAASPEFITARARILLDPPQSISFEAEGGALRAEGFASRQWITEAHRLASFIPGVASFDASKLTDADAVLHEIESVGQRIQNRTIRFEVGSAEIRADQSTALDQLASDVERLRALAQSIGREVHIDISGYNDPTGTETINAQLRSLRADNIRAALVSRGIAPEQVSAAGADTANIPRNALDRKVNFAVRLAEAANRNK
jgi:OOP family OmpA-OmpF porin